MDYPKTFADLQALIDGKVEESLILEYKQSGALQQDDKKKADITKDVSAFANSAGGVLIYGIAEGTNADSAHLPFSFSPIDRRAFSKEWLEQIIHLIQPKIEGLEIIPIQPSSNPNEVIYVVIIPKSTTAHQALDKRYHKRHNFMLVAMEDYEIRDVMDRRGKPKIEFQIKIERTQYATTKVFVRIWNKGNVIARHYAARLLVPLVVDGHTIQPKEPVLQSRDNLNFWRISIRAPIDVPLFPSYDVIRSEEFTSHFDPTPRQTGESIICTVFADDMPPIERIVPLGDAMLKWS